MSRFTVLMILGVLVAVSPYLGLPLSTLAVILPVVGLGIAAISFTLRARMTAHARREAAPQALSYDVQEA